MASPTPRFRLLYEALRDDISQGIILLGTRLPSTRVMARERGLSRTTVLAAYEQLAAEGYVEPRRGSGYWVRDVGGDLAVPEASEMPFSGAMQISRTANLPEPRLGQPDLSAFPKTAWARTVARVARTEADALFAPTPLFGDEVLRFAIAHQLAHWRGLRPHPDQILVTAGAGDALEICIRALLKKGDTIGLEEPGYLPLRQFALSLGLQCLPLPVGPLGATLPSRQAQVPLVVLTPTHHFPLGGAMVPDRRAAFITWAQETGAFILEDDYDSEFRFAGQPIPAMQSQDTFGCVLYIGSFSKIFSTSLRLGYLVIPETLIPLFHDTLKRYGTKASAMPQRALGRFLAEGHLMRHVRRMRRIYGERRRVTLTELERRLGDLVEITDHNAGLLVTCFLPSICDDNVIAATVNTQFKSVAPLSTYYSDPSLAQKGLLVGYSAQPEKETLDMLDALEVAVRENVPVHA